MLMNIYLHVLGRQPELGLAELEARFGASHVHPLPGGIARVETSEQASFSHLGGSVKIGRFIGVIASTTWQKLLAEAEDYALRQLEFIPEGKIKLGLSAYGLDVRPVRVNAGALHLKKALKNAGRSARVVPNQELILSSAQTLHNQLTSELGMELMLIKNGHETLLAQAVYVQDIDSYTLRDRGRPKRDAKVGMLPPKLAQIIINLAADGIVEKTAAQTEPYLSPKTILDPFCGTGVVLQESLLMGFRAYGTDIDERMMQYSKDNIKWLERTMGAQYGWHVEQGDATNHGWPRPFDIVAGETYLGTPLKTLPAKDELEAIIKECNTLHRRFLKSLADQIVSGTRLCLAVPAWRVGKTFRRLPVIDSLGPLGYNRIDFKHAPTKDLIYHRESQIVARELVVLKRK